MTGQEPLDNQTPPPLATPVPPTTPAGYAPPPRQSNWPTVLGIVAIIIGVMGIVGMIGMVFSLIAQSSIRPPAGHEMDFAAMQPPKPWLVVSLIILPAMGILVLASGIGLLQRRRWSVPGIRTWAVLHIVFTIVNLTVTYAHMTGMLQRMQRDAAASGAPAGVMMMGMLGGLCGGALFGIAPPIFALIWFGRRKIKNEVATWA